MLCLHSTWLSQLLTGRTWQDERLQEAHLILIFLVEERDGSGHALQHDHPLGTGAKLGCKQLRRRQLGRRRMPLHSAPIQSAVKATLAASVRPRSSSFTEARLQPAQPEHERASALATASLGRHRAQMTAQPPKAHSEETDVRR